MATPLPEELIDSVYRVVFEPAAWADVMRLVARTFPSNAQAFYYLHREPRRVQPVSLEGIAPGWLRTFDELYFAPDNPWIRLTERLHRPGVVRTNERLDRVLREHGALYRSAYYHEWMQPQGFKTTLGNTLLAEGDLVANITLFRPPEMRTFSSVEVAAFETLSRHMTRALQMAIRLERPEGIPAVSGVFDALAQPIAVVDRRRRVRYANPSMEALLRRRGGLAVRAGELVATAPGAQDALATYVDRATSRAGDALAPLALRDPAGGHCLLDAVPLVGGAAPASSSLPACVVTMTVGSRAWPHPLSSDDLRSRFGCTRAEATLAQLLGHGEALREAARAMGVTYETARTRLKRVFDKTGVHTQAQLVGLVLRGAAESGSAR